MLGLSANQTGTLLLVAIFGTLCLLGHLISSWRDVKLAAEEAFRETRLAEIKQEVTQDLPYESQAFTTEDMKLRT